jgi:hypothetical protein
MIDPKQFSRYIIKPALQAIDLYSEAAAELLLGTAIQESRLTYLKQIGGGPALGVFQMEPATHDDIWDNFLEFRPKLASKAADFLTDHTIGGRSDAESMIWNLYYAAAMCRVHYYRVSEALPEAGDISRQAEYWKAHYNTIKGAGTEQEYIENWHKYHE